MQNTSIGTPSFGTWMKSRKARDKKTIMANLMLTPMVDMFSLLVIFLLQFFTAAPDFLLTDKMELPTSKSNTELHEIPVVSLGEDQVYVEHKPIGAVKDILKNPEPLAIELQALQNKWLTEHPGETWDGEINLEAHREIASTTISQYMAVLAAQNYGTIQLIAFGD